MEVALFVTCLTDTFFPRVGEAVVRVLRHFGCRVVFPDEQTCCGQPAFNSGFNDEAAALARRMIRVFGPYQCVVSPSASCTTMVKRHYPELFAADEQWRQRAEQLGRKTHEFATFLRDELHVDIAAHLKLPEPTTYHYPCHARHVYEVDDLHGWLAGDSSGDEHGARDVRDPEHPDLCCGFGGVFAVDLPEISAPMMLTKLNELAATKARLVICNEAGCALNLSGGAQRRGIPLRFKHMAECLAESLGLMEPQE
ncbi:MAG: (Fe-S)-binding protein [Planctomycetes bacterium]|nr:(Fe-S)-binding protein [Planctomycetota bacterium]